MLLKCNYVSGSACFVESNIDGNVNGYYKFAFRVANIYDFRDGLRLTFIGALIVGPIC